MIDRQMRDRLGRGEAHIDRDPAASTLLKPEPPPAQHAAAGRAETDFERGVVLAGARVGGGPTVNADPLALIIIGQSAPY